MIQFHFLIQDTDGKHFAQTVSGTATTVQAMRMISAGFLVKSHEDSYQSASEKARQLNAANGIVPGGCSNC